jgi:hypothetical protein
MIEVKCMFCNRKYQARVDGLTCGSKRCRKLYIKENSFKWRENNK